MPLGLVKKMKSKVEETQDRPPVPRRSLKGKMTSFALVLLAVGLVVGIPGLKPKPAPAPLQPPGQRKAMADFTFPTLDGPPWTLSRHRGRVVLLNFWATWCPPCQTETPALVRIARDYGAKGLDVAGVAMDQGGLSNVQSFVAAYHVPYPILLPRPFSPVTGVVRAFPTTFLIDRQGRVANTTVGALDEASFRRELERLLQEPGDGCRRRR